MISARIRQATGGGRSMATAGTDGIAEAAWRSRQCDGHPAHSRPAGGGRANRGIAARPVDGRAPLVCLP
jgi:hypothetical protein